MKLLIAPLMMLLSSCSITVNTTDIVIVTVRDSKVLSENKIKLEQEKEDGSCETQSKCQ